jgi:nucleoid DNA-binding protein
MKKVFLNDIYNEYTGDTFFPVEKKVFLSIFNKFTKFIINKVLGGDEVQLYRMGFLKIKGKKNKIIYNEDGTVKGISPNWKKTKLLWDSNEEAKKNKKLVYNTNEHSDGIRYSFKWSKTNLILKFKTLYSLRISRDNKRAVSSKIFEGQEYELSEYFKN